MERLKFVIRDIEDLKQLNIKIINIIDYSELISELNKLVEAKHFTEEECEKVINIWNVFRRKEIVSANISQLNNYIKHLSGFKVFKIHYINS